ncbi:ABC transporter ATP-binding protein [thiotrophic endosymbiont of Bathymodiolus puteoserpentis (Logatchev)]|uniref:ABC transporter ATP-binding protein/permease n=1 Tax=thiotrophic endosymbiont of Bathymodiolus puteoserpentis (Logatchev) TaxID=343240 RepID=UPI0010B635C1|nr:ABC transporter ATP-binding protein [thiotrophic endosymbiont of Bathymodiolus puteoserpentis (Logatchev)]CAC9995304.1 Multi-drug resistance efflux ABC transporter, permease/ATP-binding protein HetA [uncultured Gammaproteobacteria bacterium]SSC10161.1 Phospholipid-lipopolysaccharide ABC transporter [thiotrophic endosymbiont of Bathymodiolus puteoserpentis (Logatchev)]
MNYFQKLRQLLDRETKRHLLWLVVFSIFVSVVETIGISAIMPFIDISVNFDSIHQNQYYQWIFVFFGFENDVNFAIVFGLTLVGFYIFRGGVNLTYNYVMANFTEELYARTTKRLFKTYLAMPYRVFTNKNSSYLTKAIITEASLMSLVIRSALMIMSEIFVTVFIYILMLIASWKITLIFTAILILKILFLTHSISKRIKVVGKVRANFQAKLYEIINRVFGNFEHIKLQNKDRLKDIESDFSTTVNKYAKANASYNFLNDFPRLFIETSGFSLIVLLLVVLLYFKQSNISYILPILSLFVLALYRLLPSVNRIVNEYNELMYYHKSIDIIGEELKTTQENLKDKNIPFNHKIELMNVGFHYQEKTVLSDINLTINKGEKIAFIGESGSGKSTLVNLIIGLHQQNQGEIKIDDIVLDESNLQNWRAQIGYIPQQVYLFDGTIADNVCFGRRLEYTLLEKVLKQANIFDFLQTKEGINTLVGEGGIQLSGGQKQRVAIARALYREPEVLVLDEATSALDDETEQKIMDEIYKISKDKTLIIIAHRLSTIKGCDKVFEIKDKKITQ